MKPKQLACVGRQFGYLTAVRAVERKDEHGWIWEFRCSCGNTLLYPYQRVCKGSKKSCGCRTNMNKFGRKKLRGSFHHAVTIGVP